jgi:protein tyrosine kinase modulator
MQQILSELLAHVMGAWRFRWHAVAIAWGTAILGWAVVFNVPNTYEVRARVYVDTDSVLRPLLSGLAVGTDLMTRAHLMSTVLLSRPNLEKVARETNLAARADSPQKLERLIDELPQRIALKAEGAGGNTFSITYQDSDAQMAHRVVQTLLRTFVEDSLGIKRADSKGAQSFLEGQIREYEGRLAEAEARLADFKKRNVGQMPGQAGDYYTRLQILMTSVSELRAQFKVASEKRAELARQVEGEEPTFGIVGEGAAGTGSKLDGPINEYKKRLDALLLQFTDKHPEVIALRETIQNLEAQRDQEATKLAAARGGQAASPATSLVMNPVYQAMKIELSRTDVELAELRSKIADQEGQIAQLRSRVTTIPEVESELTRLNRDYEVNKAQYQALLQRLESARLGEQAETSSEQAKFRLIEPPVVPLTPSAPNRPILFAAVLVFALGLGIAYAVFLHLIKPVFSTRAQLRDVLQLPVLTSVTLFSSPARKIAWYERPAAIGASLFGLIVIYVGVNIAAHYVALFA